MAKKQKSSSSNSILADLARIIAAAIYGVLMALALAYIPVNLIIRASFDTGTSANNQSESQEIAQAASPTPRPHCDGASNWWNANLDIYNDFAASMSELFSGVYDTSSVAASLTSERTTFSGTDFPACLSEARTEFLAGMDATIAAFNESDAAASEERFLTGKDHFAAGITILWELDVNTDPLSAPALDLPRGGGDNCAAVAWYNSGSGLRENFLNNFDNFNPNITSEQWDRFVQEQRDIRDQYAELEYPACAESARQHFINFMDAIVASYEDAADGELDAIFADFDRLSYELQYYTNWKLWLNINAPAAQY
jgi:hypothetical protein